MKRYSLYIIVLFIALIIIWIGAVFFKAYQPKARVLQGEIDAQSYAVSSKVAGRIGKVFVKKGDSVQKGDLIFKINSPEVTAKLKQAQAARGAANAQKIEANNGARKQQIQAAYDQYQQAKAASALMKKTYTRIQNLYKEGVVAEQKRDEVYTKWQASKYSENAAKQLYIMAKEGARKETKLAAAEQERVYAGKVDEVAAYVAETSQYAIHDGEVSQVLIHEGELAPTGFPVVSVTDINDSWARFSVREDLLKHFKKGSILQLKIPALGEEKYPFKVQYIAVMGAYATWGAAESGQGFDMKSFEVQLRPLKPISGLRVGMSTLISF
ncbi:MAG TPA: biotin/lipoyl-binding protein [Helicobacteraceae bacterium]|nr:biotin/lipoyl-binding protein [Helicobacteraceae bacterium]